MSRVAVIEQDFTQVREYLRGLLVLSSPLTPPCEAAVKSIHQMTYSLILWKFRLVGLPEHSVVFVDEIASDALQILPQITLGFAKTSRLLLRGVIENVIRHVYFADHPIEFLKMNVQPKWYMKIEDLFSYASEHPKLAPLERQFDAIHRLRNLYDDLSATVHGRRMQDLQMKSALKKIVFHDDMARMEEPLLKRAVESVNATMAAFHANQFRRFESNERRLILRTISPKGRQALAALP